MPAYHLDDLSLYGYCPLRYRYKQEWKLPYRELSPEHAYAEVLRVSISRLLLAMATGRRSVEAAKVSALRTFDQGWKRHTVGLPVEDGKVTGLKLEGHLALFDFLNRLAPDDQVIGGSFPTSVVVGEFLAVDGDLDGLIMRGDDTSRRRLLIVHVSNERSPLWSPRYQPLKFQWGLEVVRKQLGYEQGRVGHIIFSPWSVKPPRVRDATSERAEFRASAQALAKGIEAEVFFQTPHRERCKTCWYKGICTARHCGKVKPGEVEKMKAAL